MPIADRRCNAISIWMESKMFPMALACFVASLWDIVLSMWTHMTSWRLTSLPVVIPLSTKIREHHNPIVNANPKFPGLKRILRQPPEAVMCTWPGSCTELHCISVLLPYIYYCYLADTLLIQEFKFSPAYFIYYYFIIYLLLFNVLPNFWERRMHRGTAGLSAGSWAGWLLI